MALNRETLDPDILDPTQVAPHLAAVYDQMARQKGGRNNLPAQLKSAAVQGMTMADVLAKGFDEQQRRDDEKLASAMPQQTDVRTDPRFFSDGHLVGNGSGNLGGGGAATDQPGGPVPLGGLAGQAPSDPYAHPVEPSQALGGLAGPTMAPPPQAGGQAPVVVPQQVDTTRIDDVMSQIRALTSKQRAGYTPAELPPPSNASAAITALAMLLAPPHQSGRILAALTGNLDAIRQRNDILAKYHAQAQDDADKQQLEALLKQAAVEESRAYHNATLAQQADITNAGNQVKTTAEVGRNTRAAAQRGSQMAMFQERMDRADNRSGAAIASEFKARKDILRQAHPDWTEDQVDEQAAAYVNSKPELQIAQGAFVKAKTLTEDVLRDPRLQNLQSRTAYTDALKDYLPDRIAAQFAGVLLADARLQQQFEMFRQGLDQKTWEMGVTEAEKTLREAEDNYAKLEREVAQDAKKDGEDLQKARETMNALRPLMVFKNDGTLDYENTQAGDTVVTKYLEAAQRFAELNSKDSSNSEEALRLAKYKVESAKERLKEEKAKRPGFGVSAPPSGGSLLDKAKGMLRGGKRPPSMPGYVPVDPTGPGYSRTKGLGGGAANPYLDG